MTNTIVNGAWLNRQVFPAGPLDRQGHHPRRPDIARCAAEGREVLAGLRSRTRQSCRWPGLGSASQFEPGPVPRARRRLPTTPGPRTETATAGETIPEGLDFIIAVEPGTVIETITAWIADHHGQNPLVIIDTLGRVKPSARAGVSAYEHDYAVIAALKTLVDNEPGSGMVLVHHDRKAASEDFVDAVSGTTESLARPTPRLSSGVPGPRVKRSFL